jgi:hypothetical protein
MIPSGFFIQIGVGAAVVLTYFSYRLIPFPNNKIRFKFVPLILCFIFWLGFGAWLTQEDKLSTFQNSWERLQSVSNLEFCLERPQVKQGPGLAAAQFEKLKSDLNGSQKSDEKLIQEVDSVDKEICRARLTDEPWLHFRYRIAARQFNVVQTAWNNFSWSQSLQKFFGNIIIQTDLLKMSIARLVEWSSIFFQTGEKQTSFHQLWIESPIHTLEYPTSKELAQELISSEGPEWQFVQKLVLFLLPEPQRWKSDPLTPNILPLPARGFCQKVAKDPTLTAQTNSVWKHLHLFYEGCERRKIEFGKIPEECIPEKIKKSLTIACIEKGAEDQVRKMMLQKISTPVQWPGLPASLLLTAETLIIPENYLNGDSKILPYRAYRLAYAIEHTILDNQWAAQPEPHPTENLGIPSSLDFDRPQLLLAPSFELTRLELLETISPLGANELSPEVQPYFYYDRFGPRIERFQINFRKRLHKIKGELE